MRIFRFDQNDFRTTLPLLRIRFGVARDSGEGLANYFQEKRSNAGFLFPAFHDSAYNGVEIFFEPRFSLFGIISASMRVTLDEPDSIGWPEIFYENFKSLDPDLIERLCFHQFVTSINHGTGLATSIVILSAFFLITLMRKSSVVRNTAPARSEQARCLISNNPGCLALAESGWRRPELWRGARLLLDEYLNEKNVVKKLCCSTASSFRFLRGFEFFRDLDSPRF